MKINENIKIEWDKAREEAILVWKKTIEDILLPEITSRGYTLQNRSITDPIDNNEIALNWSFLKNNMYLWVQCMTHKGIQANLFPENKPKDILKFPDEETYEDNMSLDKLVLWLDNQ